MLIVDYKNGLMRKLLKQLGLGIKSIYKRFKRTRLHVDHVNYRKSRNQVKNLIKRNYIKETLTENIGI